MLILCDLFATQHYIYEPTNNFNIYSNYDNNIGFGNDERARQGACSEKNRIIQHPA